MIGKRVIRMKRPAVLFAAAFVAGSVSAAYSDWIAAGVTIGAFMAYVFFRRRLQKGAGRVSAADRLLILVPVFVLFGFFVMKRERLLYETDAAVFKECMEAGGEVVAEGTISHIRWTESGVRLELKEASAASYGSEETVYRPVGNLLVYTDDCAAENGQLKYGQRVFVYGNGSIFEKAVNPGGFDAKTYYFSLGITGAIHGKTVRITEFSCHRLHQALFQAKNRLLQSYVTYLGEEGAGVVSSMLLGERVLLSEETEELYRHGGISHILAISGLHVSLIGTALYEVLRKTVLGRNGAIPVSCTGVILYGTFVEAGTSTKRAVIMFLLLLLATALGRTYDTLSAMSVSVIVILCGSPGALYTASFQLSFAAAYGASVLAVLLKGREREQGEAAGGNVFMDRIKSMFIFGLAIQAVTFPFTAVHFFEYPTYGFLWNPVVVPLMTILLLCGLLSGVCGLFVPWFGYFFAGGAGGVLWIYETLCQWIEKMPGALLLIGKPEVWQILVYFALLAACLYVWQGRGRKRVKRDAAPLKNTIWHGLFFVRRLCERSLAGLQNQKGVLWVLLLLPLCLFPLPGARLEAAFLDVGQGDGIVLQERNGAVLLVDGGSSSVQNVGEKRIIPYLKSQGIRVIDCALVSHTDSDHMNGVKEILEAMPVYSEYRESALGYTGTPVIKRIVLPAWYEPGAEESAVKGAKTAGKVLSKTVGKSRIDEATLRLEELAKEKNVEVLYMEAGDRMEVGNELVLSCLAPEEGVVYADKNAASLVLLVSYAKFDMLLTGDMEKEGEARLLENGSGWNEESRIKPAGVDSGKETAAGQDLTSVEVLKVAHHGSYTSSSERFIAALRPQVAVISCGKNKIIPLILIQTKIRELARSP